jgi:pimeloyl-ACP methyl ester carboxylesterase
MQAHSYGHADSIQETAKADFADPTDVFRRGPRDFLDVGHSRLAYYRFGSGPDVVFIHGWPLNASTFRGLIPRLADRYTCHLFDLPGSGHSEPGPDTPLGLDGHADTAKRAVRALGLSRYALVAHDSGGYMARRVAADDSRLAGLVLGNTEIPGHAPFLIAAYARLAFVPGFSEVMRNVLRVPALRRSSLGFGSCFESSDYIDGEFKELIVDPLLASPRAMATQLAMLRSVDFAALDAALLSSHERILAKTLLIWGTDDTFFPIAKARAMLPQFKAGATMAEIPRGRIFAQEERAAEFAAHTRSFLDACFAR